MSGIVDKISEQRTLGIIDQASKLTWALSSGVIPLIAGTALAAGWGGKALYLNELQCGWLRSFAKAGLAIHHGVQTRDHVAKGKYRLAVYKGSLAAFETLYGTCYLFMGINALKPMEWANTACQRTFQLAIGITPIIYLSVAADICCKKVQTEEKLKAMRHDAIFLVADTLGTALLYWGFTQPFHEALPWGFVAVAAATDLHQLWTTQPA